MAFEKILKNTTGLDIFLKFPGVEIPAGGQITINVEEYLDFAANDAILEITPLINSGDIVVNNGTVDYSAADGIRFLEYTDRLTAKEDGTDKAIVVTDLNFKGSAAVTDQGNGQADIEIGANLFGALWQMTFTEDGSADNEWLGLYDRGVKSNRTLGIIPFDCEVCVITFSNSRAGADCDIEIYAADAGDGNNASKVYEWKIVDKRHQCITPNPVLQFSAGDKIGIFCQDQGGDPENVVVTIYFRITSTNKCNGGENFSGNIESSNPGAT